MITILSGTNRPASRARRVAAYYATLLTELGAEHQLLDLTELPTDFTSTARSEEHTSELQSRP